MAQDVDGGEVIKPYTRLKGLYPEVSYDIGILPAKDEFISSMTGGIH